METNLLSFALRTRPRLLHSKENFQGSQENKRDETVQLNFHSSVNIKLSTIIPALQTLID